MLDSAGFSHRERTCKVNGQHKSTCLYPENVQEEVETADFGEEACRDIVASWLAVIWMKNDEKREVSYG